MSKKVAAICGATCCDNTKQEIQDYVCTLCNEIFIQNNLTKADIISITFTVTKEITKLSPVEALKTGNCKMDVSEIPFICALEPDFDGSLEYLVRVVVTAYINEFTPKHDVYINGAERLRPDF